MCITSTLIYSEHYNLWPEPIHMRAKSKWNISNNKKILSLHSLHSLHGLQSAWSAFEGDGQAGYFFGSIYLWTSPVHHDTHNFFPTFRANVFDAPRVAATGVWLFWTRSCSFTTTMITTTTFSFYLKTVGFKLIYSSWGRVSLSFPGRLRLQKPLQIYPE